MIAWVAVNQCAVDIVKGLQVPSGESFGGQPARKLSARRTVCYNLGSYNFTHSLHAL